MITVNDCCAWITIGGKTCEEYDVQVSEETRTVTCWIASEEGKEYEVNWKCNRLTDTVNGGVSVDGTRCGGKLLRTAGHEIQMTGVRTSHTTIARFIFSPVKTTDDNASILTPDSPELGDIKINLRTVQSTQQAPFQETPAEKTFHETAKKCGNHQTRFQPTTVAYASVVSCKEYGEPVAVFRFKYRPLGILQASGIAPRPQPQLRSPSPLHPSTNKRSRPEHGSDEEDVKPDVLELCDEDEDDDAKLRDLRNQIAAIEAKKKRKGSTSRKKVKLEPTKREPLVGITIDLTDD
ncbi:hypothetical protein PQX77_009702 [Marasmius sp. AFHP31]|nr:hypothetical protein PQX77_009702 [Marasmius sp. AFHP31]